ncbi:hypothetical protein Lfu02_32460 [Longispora fulva]|uniref:Uncharacterized protein n=1 Tax=Longispora fulva TaxID=619741 RepID=A0A8J7KS95_9ACTN|nr:hypothetical protein [Longispora fulva]MBG6139377.1 hypothetical protein [Longispora fulva]GIG58874.1 hypothetical protein Lfu02_32460 [Longispora fulva]
MIPDPQAVAEHTMHAMFSDPTTFHEFIGYMVESAWHSGYQHALRHVATRQVEIAAAPAPLAPTWEEQVAARIAEMETYAADHPHGPAHRAADRIATVHPINRRAAA